MVGPHVGVDREERRRFWTEYQPGLRSTDAEVGDTRFFEEVDAYRYVEEPDIEEMVDFSSWSGSDVLEAGCGMATDGTRFVRAGANYTGVDFSPTALSLARERLAGEQLAEGQKWDVVEGDITRLPFPDGSFDLVYSNGVIHHVEETERVVAEFHRVLRPGGRVIVMVYHRRSLNYYFTIMTLRRILALALLVPGGSRLVARLTGEREEVLEGHRELLRRRGLRYLADRREFLSHNTDGPGNPLSKVYTRSDANQLFNQFGDIECHVRYLNVRLYPGLRRLRDSRVLRPFDRSSGWHLWVKARKA